MHKSGSNTICIRVTQRRNGGSLGPTMLGHVTVPRATTAFVARTQQRNTVAVKNVLVGGGDGVCPALVCAPARVHQDRRRSPIHHQGPESIALACD